MHAQFFFSPLRSTLALILLCLAPVAMAAPPPAMLALPTPQTSGGKPLMDTLLQRQSTKTPYRAQTLTTQTLSNLLWAAYGVNRPATGGRTVPSALKSYEIDVYVIMAQGAFRYEPFKHALAPVTAQDLRAAAGGKGNLKDAPLHLLYVADNTRLAKVPPEKRAVYSAVHCGFIGQNVYLFCASEGLGTVFREGADRKRLTEGLRLGKEQEIVFTQTVGYVK